jgi:membrane-associated PAP2 superfamily phosphatase
MQPSFDSPAVQAGAKEITPNFAPGSPVAQRVAWLLPALRPLLLAAAAVLLIEWLDLDRALARALFYGDAHQWLGAGAASWWARGIIHTGGRLFVYGIAVAALLCWALSFFSPRLGQWRREALFIFTGMLLVTGTVGLLKLVTNVDCPWDLAGFGGEFPYVPLFAHRPDYLPHAQCFPGAHSSSGFALLSCYFALRGRRPRLARGLLVFAVLVGGVFAFGQEARGAHFLSHDLTSAALAWGILQALSARFTARSSPRSTRSFPWPGSREYSATRITTGTTPARR